MEKEVTVFKGIDPSTVQMVAKRRRVDGGGKNPFVEEDKPTIGANDRDFFALVQSYACDTRPIDVKAMLEQIPRETMKEISAQLGVGKSNHLPKIKSIVDNMKVVRDLALARDKCENSLEVIRNKISRAIWDYVCQLTDEGEFDMTVLKMMIKSIIGDEGMRT